MIVEHARKNDPIAERALGVFAAFLGTFAGDLAMSFRAYDGVYIGGPIVSRLTEEAIHRFHHRFSERGKRNHQLKGVPVTLVTNEFNALLGLRDALPSVRGTI
jgi:glucokinase